METAIDQSDARTCPVCGSPLPSDAPQGLCPKCLLAGATAATEPSTGASPHYPPQAPPLDQVAAAFPQYEVLELIGAGGMGAVFKARQPHLDRLVALKILPQSLAANPTFAERFNREARVLARLNHPNIVTVHDFGRAGDFFFLLMEYVDGVNLRQAMQAGRFSPEEALRIVPSICEALQFAHEEGILHRDIKPENILLDARGRVKIADFGIAKLIGEVKPDVTLTGTGAAIGTPQYMAPEQLERPAEVDHRADIYSLGVVFYEMLTGELPMGRFAPPSAKTPVGAQVDEVVLRTLEKERERRFQTAAEMKTEVENATHAGQAPPSPQSSAPQAGPSRGFGPASPSPRSTATPWVLLILGIASLMVMGTIVLGATGLFAVLALGGGRSNIAISPLLGVAVLLCFFVLIVVLGGIAVLYFLRRRRAPHAHGEKGPLGSALSAANLAVLSTGASVVLFLPVLLFAWHSVEPLSHGASLSLIAFIGVACLTLLSLGLGILGMISGWHALRTLRSNQGRGPGRRRAVFGAAGWPLLLLTTVPTGACWLFLSQTSRGLTRLILLEAAVVGPMLAVGLLWWAWRWSTGSTRGQRPNRGTLVNLLGALTVVLLLPLVLYFFFPAATAP